MLSFPVSNFKQQQQYQFFPAKSVLIKYLVLLILISLYDFIQVILDPFKQVVPVRHFGSSHLVGDYIIDFKNIF